MGELIEQIIVPTEKVVEVRRGRKVDAERKFFPGYVLVRATLTDAVFSLIKNTPEGDRLPRAIPSRWRSPTRKPSASCTRCRRASSGRSRRSPSRSAKQVRVSDGPFASFNGFVQEVDEDRARLKVEVSIFGRAVPVDLEFGQVEKG